MKSNAAVLHEQPGKWETVEVDLDPPRQGELLIRMMAAGLCHSDDHVATGDLPVTTLPAAGGHEGAGIVDEVGPNTPGWAVGDHVVLSFLPACGLCRWCASGMQNLCDSGARTLSGTREDGSFRMSLNGDPVGQMAGFPRSASGLPSQCSQPSNAPKTFPLIEPASRGAASGRDGGPRLIRRRSGRATW
jgi:Zn-dependent alcohol dehydrogenase